MFKNKRFFALFLTVVFSLSLLAAPALAITPNELGVPAADEDPKPLTREEKADQAASLALTYGGAESLQYALVENGELILSGNTGVYSRDENRALTEDILYGVGSVSKIYTTAAVMLLAEQGKVELDAPVTRYIEDFVMADERYRDITVRMLLNHSSGLMGSTTSNGFLFEDKDSAAKDSLLADLAAQRLKADPGAYSVYCNDGFTLAEILVERVSGQSFTPFLRQYIIGPLGLKETFTPQEEFDRSLLAKTYLGEGPRATPNEALGIIGTGGIYATARDLAAFGGAFTEKGNLLDPASLEAMENPEYKNGLWPDEEGGFLAYGLGWDSVEQPPFSLSGIKALVKGGDTVLYHASLVVLPEYNLSCAVVSSGGVSTINQMAAMRILTDALAEKGITLKEVASSLPEAEAAVMPASLLKYAGDYAASGQAIKVEIKESGELVLSAALLPEGPFQNFRYYSDGTFRDETGAIALSFAEEANGQTYILERVAGDYPGLGAVQSAGYSFVRLPANPVSQETAAAWEDRAGKTYLLLNEKYTSEVYALAFPGMVMPLALSPEGYFLANTITGADKAEGRIQIPGTGGRDLMDLEFSQKGNVELMSALDSLYADSGVAHDIWPGPASVCTILEDGYARWFKTGEAAGKTMTADLPEKGAFYVYDENYTLTGASLLTGQNSVVLPADGWIVFAGDPGQSFRLTLTETLSGSPEETPGGQETDSALAQEAAA